MKIGVPVLSGEATLENAICDHFGSAPYFSILETETNLIKTVTNNHAEHEHGACNPLAALAGENVDAVIVRGIGGGAVRRLEEAGIPVYQTSSNDLKAAFEEFKSNKLEKISLNGTCAGHSQGHSCH